MRTADTQRLSALVTLNHTAAAEQPGVLPLGIGEAIFSIEGTTLHDQTLAQLPNTLTVLRMNALVELPQRQTPFRQPKTTNETAADLHALLDHIDIPDALSRTFQHHLQMLLRLPALMLAIRQMRARLHHSLRHILQLADARMLHRRLVVALADLPHHRHHPADGICQEMAQTPRAQPHQGKEHHVESHQTRNQPVAQIQIALRQTVGLGKHPILIHNHQQAPAGLLNLAPGHQLLAPTEQHLLHTTGGTDHAAGQRLQTRIEIETEVLRFELLASHRLVVGVMRQLTQAEISLTRRRQGQNAAVATDQHGVAGPRHAQATDLLKQLAHGQVQAGDTLKKIAAIHRRNRRHHPAKPCRVQIDIGPHLAPRRVVPGIGKVIEVVLGNDHVMRILLGRHEERQNPVVTVPGIEIDRRYLRIGRTDRCHQRIDLCQAQCLGMILLRRRRTGRIKRCRAPLIAKAVEHPGRRDGMPGNLQRIWLITPILQGNSNSIAIDLQVTDQPTQLPVDHPRLTLHGHIQTLQRRLMQMLDLSITDRSVGQQIHGNQHRLHQHQRHQRALHKGTPHPAKKRFALNSHTPTLAVHSGSS